MGPKHWEFVDPKESVVEVAEALFFGFASCLDQEPIRILRDEGIAGLNALSLLEAIGRGAEKPSEVAARLGTAQTNLSRLFQQLLDASILERVLPFGESVRSTKRVLYRIRDPALRFWFRVFSPHRSRWNTYGIGEKRRLIHEHASTVFEDYCRGLHRDSARCWEGDLEFDLVRADPRLHATHRMIVSEVKWKRLSARRARRCAPRSGSASLRPRMTGPAISPPRCRRRLRSGRSRHEQPEPWPSERGRSPAG